MLTSYLVSWLPLLILGGLAAILMQWLGVNAGRSAPPAPVAKPLMAAAMLAQIERILPAYRIHAQVAMGAILMAPSRPRRCPVHSDRNAFAQKVIDFVVEDSATGRVVALIEVDGRSHASDKDRARDAMTGAAGYRTLRIPAGTKLTFNDVPQIVGILRHAEPADGSRSVARPRG